VDNFELMLARAKRGDTEAEGRLFCSSRKRLWRIAYMVLQDEEDAKDATQDAFVKAFGSLRSLRASDQKGWEAWLVTHTCNCAKDRYAARAPLALPRVDPPEWFDDGRLLPDAQTVLSLRLQALLRRLPFGKRSAVVLVDMYGWTRKEAARMLGVPQGTIDSWICDARKKLRQALESEHD